MKSTILTICFSVFICFISLSQDSIYIVSRPDIVKYRRGYLVMSNNDTVRGLIYHKFIDKIYFIKEGMKIKTPISGNFSSIPCFFASDPDLKGFYKDGLFFEGHPIYPNSPPLFLHALERGSLNLYQVVLYVPNESSADAALDGAFTNMAKYPDKSSAENYNNGGYFVQRGKDEEAIPIPQKDKNFREAFYPLIKDNPTFLKGLVGRSFDYEHLHDLVKEYNSTSKN
jgi:hypothetical protein